MQKFDMFKIYELGVSEIKIGELANKNLNF